MYIHGWFTGTNNTCAASDSNCQPISYGTVHGVYILRNSTIEDSAGHVVLNGVTYNEGTMGGCSGCTYEYGNTVHDGWMGCSSVYSCHDNSFYNIISLSGAGGITYNGIHSHVIYEDSPSQTTTYVYNNMIHDTTASSNISIFYHSYVFNNVMYRYTQAAIALVQCNPGQGTYPCGDSSGQVGYVANNTIDGTFNTNTGLANSCFRSTVASPSASGGLGTLNFYNNICIPSSSGVGGYSVATLQSGANHTMDATEANTYGFTSANKYKPTSSDPNVSAGANLTTSCAGPLTVLCADASGASWFGGTAQGRPGGSTAWALGAYASWGDQHLLSRTHLPISLRLYNSSGFSSR